MTKYGIGGLSTARTVRQEMIEQLKTVLEPLKDQLDGYEVVKELDCIKIRGLAMQPFIRRPDVVKQLLGKKYDLLDVRKTAAQEITIGPRKVDASELDKPYVREEATSGDYETVDVVWQEKKQATGPKVLERPTAKVVLDTKDMKDEAEKRKQKGLELGTIEISTEELKQLCRSKKVVKVIESTAGQTITFELTLQQPK